MALKIDAAVSSNMGRVRKNNEDNFYFNGLYMDETKRDAGGLFSRQVEDDLQIYAVCDGMGGEDAGEEASITAVRALETYAKNANRVDGTQDIADFLQETSNTIEDQARSKGIVSGTTIAMIIFHNGAARIIHVGDSRVYMMEHGVLKRMTLDHSEVQRLVTMGIIREEEMATHPMRHRINQFLGLPRADALLSPGISERDEQLGGKRYLLCSDGLTDMVNDNDIAAILSSSTTAEEASKRLCLTALKNGGKDNVTNICLFVKDAASAVTNFDRVDRKKKLSLGGMVLSGLLMAFMLFLLFWGFPV